MLFKYRSTWVGVEVKAKNVDDAELMRGIFQAVKYRALIEAEQRYEQQTVSGRVILAIEGKLPANLCALADLLEVEVLQNIVVPTDFTLRATAASA